MNLRPLVVCLSFVFAAPASAATWIVNDPGDEPEVNTGDGVCDVRPGQAGEQCTLRGAILHANANPGTDTILFDAGAGSSIVIASTLPEIIGTLIIDGPGATALTIDGGGDAGILVVAQGESLTVRGLTLRNGRTIFGGAVWTKPGASLVLEGCVVRDCSASTTQGGGAIYVEGDELIVDGTRFESNSAPVGGAIFVASTTPVSLTIDGGTFIGNNATGAGGGGAIAGNATQLSMAIRDSTFATNTSGRDGGALELAGMESSGMRIERSTFAGNAATRHGGALSADDDLLIVNSTFSDNRAGTDGGALYLLAGTVRIFSSTLTANRASTATGGLQGQGGAIAVAGAFADMGQSLVAGNVVEDATIGVDCSGGIASLGHNLLGNDVDCSFAGQTSDIVGRVSTGALAVDPLLAPLTDNGGPTRTHALRAGSPAIDAGPATGCVFDPGTGSQPLSIDQRGLARTSDGDDDGVARCDIGAYERQAPDAADGGGDGGDGGGGGDGDGGVTDTPAPRGDDEDGGCAASSGSALAALLVLLWSYKRSRVN